MVAVDSPPKPELSAYRYETSKAAATSTPQNRYGPGLGARHDPGRRPRIARALTLSVSVPGEPEGGLPPQLQRASRDASPHALNTCRHAASAARPSFPPGCP